MEGKNKTVHILPTRGDTAPCGARDEEMNADINLVTCDKCIRIHEEQDWNDDDAPWNPK